MVGSVVCAARARDSSAHVSLGQLGVAGLLSSRPRPSQAADSPTARQEPDRKGRRFGLPCRANIHPGGAGCGLRGLGYDRISNRRRPSPISLLAENSP